MSSQSQLRVSRFAFGDRWVVVMTNLKGIQGQSLLREDGSFPIDKVKKWMDEGKRITDVVHGQGTWAILAERPDADSPATGSQFIYFGERFPDKEIESAWKQNEKINALAWGDNTWVLVTEMNTGPVVGQGILSTNDFDDLKKEIQSAWTKNKAVLRIVWANGVWYALTQMVDKVPGQGFYANSDWPMEKIQENLKNKKYITSLAWDPKEEFWVLVFGPLDGGMKMATTENFPTEKLKEVPNFFQYGKRD